VTIADIWYVFAAVWAVVCAWVVVRGLRLRVLLASVALACGSVDDSTAASYLPSCGGVLTINAAYGAYVARCSVPYTWMDIAAAPGSQQTLTCGNVTSATSGLVSAWDPSQSHYDFGCASNGELSQAALSSAVSTLAGVCAGSYGSELKAGGYYEAWCSAPFAMGSLGVFRPDLFPSYFLPYCPVELPDVGLKSGVAGLSSYGSKSAVWMLFAAFWAVICAGLVVMGLRIR